MLLSVVDLSVDIRRGSDTLRVVEHASVAVDAGEVVGLVGESGAGKSMVARSIIRLLPARATMRSGRIIFDGTDVTSCTKRELRHVRGKGIGIVLQDPMSSLDPTMPIGRQVSEGIRLHRDGSAKEARAGAEEMLARVGLPDVKGIMPAYPHQLSGGMRQRVAIAMALAVGPKLLIADEPTTALDVTIQAQIVELLMNLKDALGLAILLISHDIALVSSVVDRVVVMYGGEVVEEGRTVDVIGRPLHRYTESLLRAALGSSPAPLEGGQRSVSLAVTARPEQSGVSVGCCYVDRCTAATSECASTKPSWEQHRADHGAACYHPLTINTGGYPESHSAERPRVSVSRSRAVLEPSESQILLRAERVSKEFPVRKGLRSAGTRLAVSNVSLHLNERETLGIIGESGCGKTTLARLLVGLERPTSGRIAIRDTELFTSRGRPVRHLRRRIQLMFQDPYGSLDPRMRVLRSLREPLDVQSLGTKSERDRRVRELLESVGLTAGAARLFPHEFSGGQRQRLAFARSVILRPDIVVADEPVSSLDVSVRSRVLSVMSRLQAEFGLSFVIISHDIGTVRDMADRLLVMYAGRVVEDGPATSILDTPRHPYTEGLLSSVPRPRAVGPGFELPVGVRGEFSPDQALGGGCPFRIRCPRRQANCDTTAPELSSHGSALGTVACHYPAAVVGERGTDPAPYPAGLIITTRDGPGGDTV